MPKFLHKITRTEAVCAAALIALLVYVAPMFFRQSRTSAEAQTLLQRHERLRAALDRNDQKGAESLLREMIDHDPDSFARNNYDYLLARLLQNRRMGAEAGTFFLRVANRNSPLAGYSLWHMAEIARARGARAEEQKLLQKFISQYGDHLLRERAIDRLSDSYFKTGQYQNTIDALRSLPRTRRDAQAMTGETQLAMRQAEAARQSFESVLASGSMDDASLRACVGLDRIDAAAASVLTETERLRRARVYQFSGKFIEGRQHLRGQIRG